MTCVAAPTGKRGRRRDQCNAAILTLLTLQALFGMALGRIEPWECHWFEWPWRGGFVESLLRVTGLDRAVPDLRTISRRQNTLKADSPCRGPDAPRLPLVDSTGLGVKCEGGWNVHKHSGSRRRVWRRIHIGIGEKSPENRAAEFTSSDIGDVPMVPEFLDRIPPERKIATVSADGAFDTLKRHNAIAPRESAVRAS